MKHIFVLAALLLPLLSPQAMAQVWEHTGPGAAAGGITCFLLDPNNPANVFSCINCGGFRKSTDSGQSWAVKNNGLVYEQDGIKGHQTEGLNVHPVYGTYFLGSKTWRIYTSDNDGDSWELSYDLYDHYPEPGRKDYFGTFAFDPNNPDIVYAGVWNIDTFESDELTRAQTTGLILKGNRSFDGEKYIWDWTEFANNESFPGIAYGNMLGFPAIVVHPDDSDTIFVSTTEGLYKTANGGSSWNKIDLETGTGMEVYSTGNFVIDPVEHNVMYVTVLTCPNNTISDHQYCHPDPVIIGCTESKRKPGKWHGGILKSTDNGSTWYPIIEGLDKGFYKLNNRNECYPLNYFDIQIDPSDHNRIYTGQFSKDFENSVIYRSDDGGESGWYEVAWYRYDGVTEDTNIEFAWKIEKDGSRVISCGKVLINPDNPNEVYFYGRPAQVFKSDNALSSSPSWHYLGAEKVDGRWRTTGLEGIATPNGVAISPWNSSRVLFGFADHDTMLSEDGGFTLKSVEKEGHGGKIIFDRFDSNLLYVARSGPSESAYEGSVQKSTDAGNEGSWIDIGGTKDWVLGLPYGGFIDIILDNPDENTRRLYVPLFSTKEDASKGIYMKNGINDEPWELVWKKSRIRSIEGYPEYDFTHLFAGKDNDGIYRLDISNYPTVVEEKVADESLVGNIIFEIRKDSLGNIYAATVNGVWKSTDLGDNWNLLRSVNEARDFVIHPNNDSLMYLVSTVEGIWRSDDSGATWVDVTDGIETRVFMLLALDQSNQSRVITATRCSGEWIGYFPEEEVKNCSGLAGHECLINESCPGEWLNASDSDRCCSEACRESHRADENNDGCIVMDELMGFITHWKGSSLEYPMREMMQAIALWRTGEGC